MTISDEGYVPDSQTAFQRLLGIRYFPPSPGAPAGSMVLKADVRDDLRGPAGSLEGGVVATMIDVAGASCAATALESLVATQAISLCYLAPVKVGPATATAQPLRVGARDAVVEVRVHDPGSDGRLCATALLTAVKLPSRPAEPSERP
jgi:uncharacterized protein (TIGR00369 family)